MSEHAGKTALANALSWIKNDGDVYMGEAGEIRSIASYVSSLEARLEKAEAELDRTADLLNGVGQEKWEMSQEYVKSVERLADAVATARNDALEEAEHSLDAACAATGGHFVVARDMIRALKSHS